MSRPRSWRAGVRRRRASPRPSRWRLPRSPAANQVRVPRPQRPGIGPRILDWTFAPAAALVVVLAGGGYAWAIARVARRGRHWPGSRGAAFAGGLLVLAVATQSPIAAHDRTSFTAHVTQHLLLGMAAPLLLALGAPVTLVLQASSRATRRRLLRVIHSRPVELVTHPLVAWTVFTGTLFALYFSPLYRLSLRNSFVHDAVHVHFLLAGAAFFWPIVGLDPTRWRLAHGTRLLAVALVIPLHAFLGLAIVSSSTPWLAPAGGAAGLADQRDGGAVLWLAGDLLAVAAAGIVAVQWIAADALAARREDAAVG